MRSCQVCKGGRSKTSVLLIVVLARHPKSTSSAEPRPSMGIFLEERSQNRRSLIIVLFSRALVPAPTSLTLDKALCDDILDVGHKNDILGQVITPATSAVEETSQGRLRRRLRFIDDFPRRHVSSCLFSWTAGGMRWSTSLLRRVRSTQ